jgi:hypothetical protein
MHFIGIDTDTLVVSQVKADALPDFTAAAATFTGGANTAILTGYEGSDSSFDARMAVSRFGGQVKVYVNDADVTDSLDDDQLQDVKYPVLCGPFVWAGGSKPTQPTAYVAGEAP